MSDCGHDSWRLEERGYVRTWEKAVHEQYDGEGLMEWATDGAAS